MPPPVDSTERNQEIFNFNPFEFTPPEPQPQLETPVLPQDDKNLFLQQNNLRGDTMRVGLFNNFDQPTNLLPTQQPTTLDQSKVDDAVKSIKESLSEGWTDWDVSHGDLESIQTQFKGLNAAETNQAFEQLSDGDLEKLASELDGMNGGYSDADKKTFFNELAAKLDARGAARFVNALGNREEDIQSFANSVAQNGSTEAKVGLINAMTDRVETNPRSAIAVAELLGGLSNDPAALEGVLRDLGQPQLEAIMRAATQEEIHSTYSEYGGIYTTSDPKPLVNFINAVSKISDPELKANVFQAASLQLGRIESAGGVFNPAVGKESSATDVRNALTNLLKTDTTGIMRELEHNYRNGDGVTAYTKSMFNAGETEELGSIVSSLSKGNGLTGDPLARFGQQTSGTDGRPHYQNAQVLGYFSGALFSGAKQITSDRTKQADMLKNVFGTIAGATGAINLPAGVASSVVNGLTSAIVNEVVDGLNKGTMTMEEAVEKLTFPRDTTTGETYEGAAEADYDSAFSRVVLRNS